MAFRGKPHKLTREDRIKGGKTMTETRRLTNSINSRKKCDKTCKIFPCSFQLLSIKKYDGECSLKRVGKKNPRIMSRYIDLITRGEEGLKQHITELVNDMFMTPKMSPKEKTAFIKVACDVAKTFYGTKLQMSGDLNVNANIKGSISFEEIKKALQEEAEKESESSK